MGSVGSIHDRIRTIFSCRFIDGLNKTESEIDAEISEEMAREITKKLMEFKKVKIVREVDGKVNWAFRLDILVPQEAPK